MYTCPSLTHGHDTHTHTHPLPTLTPISLSRCVGGREGIITSGILSGKTLDALCTFYNERKKVRDDTSENKSTKNKAASAYGPNNKEQNTFAAADR